MKHIGHIVFKINHTLYYVKQSAYLNLKILKVQDLNT
jgi:hypothetical protein